ncbi:DUF6087 family protein [Streptomyces sp. NPDC101151]|uniref:DUF6087 family protein n=1 Tax=Streptomyces sp. NPDC101151 TaxID=3366115 RepID=UPI0038211FB9
MEWDGYQWVPVTTVDNYAAAQRMLHGIEGDGRMELPATGPNPMIGHGRHRKP